MREGNRKDVPSEMRNGFVRLFVCLWCRVASVYKIVAWRSGGCLYLCSGGCLYLGSGAYIIVFGQFFDLEGGSLKGRKIFGAKKTLDLRFLAFLCFRLPLFYKEHF